MKYGKWEIIEKITGGKVIAKCDCGTVKEQWLSNIKSGKSSKCAKCQSESYKTRGLHFDIGGVKTKLYNVYQGIKRRCYNKNQKSYANYGANGVVMCEEWKSSYKSFYDWAINNGYTEGMAISRFGDTGNYEPSNCKIQTFSDNSKEVKHIEFTLDMKNNSSLVRCGITNADLENLINECTSGKFLSNEIVSKYNIDRHTIVKILRRNGKSPVWRKGLFTDEQIQDIRNKYEVHKNKTIDISLEYGVTQESICCVVKRRGVYKDR